ncbi:MAG: hypothetical protein CL910_10940 [Deltaproteobacteria bacterium]|jgi:hypothetical protein|nr:hypothetical protein [Deltaproteobacteria bacterium]
MRFPARWLAAFSLVLLPMGAAAADEIFGPTDHCVAYRTVKDMWFFVDTPIVGKSCDVTVSVSGDAARIEVAVPIESLDSRNGFRDGAVAELLGQEKQPDLRFSTLPLDAEALRPGVQSQKLTLAGVLSFGGREFPVEFAVELVESDGRHYASGLAESTFESFEIEVPTVAGGLIARPHEALELAFHFELERVEGLQAWAEKQGLLPSAAE